MLRENKLESDNCKSFFPKNKAKLLRVYAYAKFFKGEGLDCGLLKDAADLFFQSILRDLAGEWNDHSEWALLSAVRLSLVCDLYEKAREFLQKAPNFKFNSTEATILACLAERNFSSVNFGDFIKFYDQVRSPSVNLEYYRDVKMHRIEIGLLKVKFFPDSGEKFTYSEVLNSISR